MSSICRVSTQTQNQKKATSLTAEMCQDWIKSPRLVNCASESRQTDQGAPDEWTQSSQNHGPSEDYKRNIHRVTARWHNRKCYFCQSSKIKGDILKFSQAGYKTEQVFTFFWLTNWRELEECNFRFTTIMADRSHWSIACVFASSSSWSSYLLNAFVKDVAFFYSISVLRCRIFLLTDNLKHHTCQNTLQPCVRREAK